MSRRCSISNKGPMKGNNVSHAHNKTRKTWNPNLQWKRIFDTEAGQWVRLRVSSRILRTIDKKGLAATLRDHNISL
ncbi:MAG: 50S ribosomal protein L28 [bacterium]|nr:50S ribosomal protein L28 [bacterium]